VAYTSTTQATTAAQATEASETRRARIIDHCITISQIIPAVHWAHDFGSLLGTNLLDERRKTAAVSELVKARPTAFLAGRRLIGD
jgi:hypothetical protein